MRRLMLTSALVPSILAPLPALSEDVALVLGNNRYEVLGDMSRGAEPVDAAIEIEEMGFTVVALPNGRAPAVARALEAFLADMPDAERLLVVLSGRFATDGDRSWFLLPENEGPGILSIDETALSIESVLAVLARAPGRSLLILGENDSFERAFDPWLSEGIGDLDVPQGVTVVRASPQVVAGFMANGLVQPGANLSEIINRNPNLTVEGFLPSTFLFMPDRAPRPVPNQPVTDEAARAEEEALWTGALALDTVEGYRNYLSRYPAGRHVAEAEQAIAAILAEPNRAARLTEDALALTRDQRREIQRDLSLLGYNTRGIDGIFGPGTRGAITNWQQQNGFAQTSYLDAEQINRLDAQAARRAQELAAEAERERQALLRADRAFWEETGAGGDAAGLRAYLERYPEDGQFTETAIAALAEIERQARITAQERDRAAWQRAADLHTVAGYRAYIAEFPRGAFVDNARNRIDNLTRAVENAPVQDAARAAEQALNLNGLTARLLEERLAELGFDAGPTDGTFDAETRQALRQYQRQSQMPVTGFVDEQTLIRLLADALGRQLGD